MGLPAVIVHQLEFRVVPGHDAEVTGFLRHAMFVAAHPAGVVMLCAGKRLGTHRSEHLVVTCWRNQAAYLKGTDAHGVPAFLSAKAEWLSSPRALAFEVAGSIGSDLAGARIMRVYRARIPAGSVAVWEERARAQLSALASRDGLVCVRAGVGRPAIGEEVHVSVISAWRDWAAVLAATGGHIDRLVQDTEFEDIEQAAGLDHYQLLDSDPS
jgi:hypothetical protein